MAIFIPDRTPLRSAHAQATAPLGTLSGRVLLHREGEFSQPLTLAELAEFAEHHLAGPQAVWVPVTLTDLIRHRLDTLRPFALCADLLPLPLQTWITDHGLEWDMDAGTAAHRRLYDALDGIASALKLRPGLTLRQRVLSMVPAASVELPVRHEVGPLPEPLATSHAIRAFAPHRATEMLATPVPIGPWFAVSSSTGEDADLKPVAGEARLTQVLSIRWACAVPSSIEERYRPGRWYAEPELQVLRTCAVITTGASYRSPSAATPWVSLLPASVQLADWRWEGPDLLDPTATIIASAVWAALTHDPHSAAAEWWRSRDRATRLRICIDSGAQLVPAAPGRLNLPEGQAERATVLATLSLGWMPPATALAAHAAEALCHWAAIIAQHPGSGLPQLAAAHHLTTMASPDAEEPSSHAAASTAVS